MKKIISILAVLVLFLTGCNTQEDDSKIVVWAMGEEGNRLHNLTDQYQEETGIEIEVVAIPWDQAFE